jgi:hypothetical protein
MTKPLLDLLKKNCPLNENRNNIGHLRTWKKSFHFPYVEVFRLQKSFEVHIYANDFAMGGVFIEDGHPIDFESKKNLWNIVAMEKS